MGLHKSRRGCALGVEIRGIVPKDAQQTVRALVRRARQSQVTDPDFIYRARPMFSKYGSAAAAGGH